MLYKTHWVRLSEPSLEREMDLHLSRSHILRYWAGTPDQHRQTNRLYRRMRIGAAQRELSRNNGERVLAPGYACVSRAEWLRRYRDTVLPKGARFWYKGNDGFWWVGKSLRVRRRMGYSWSEFGRSGADQAPSFPGALHTLNGGRMRFLVPAGSRSQRVLSGGPT